MSVVLLVNTTDGNLVGVRFDDVEEARLWEDDNPELEVSGVVDLVTRAEAKARS